MTIAILLVNQFCFSVVKISGISMKPTLHEGDYVIVHKRANIQIDDVVLACDPNGQYIIKRAVGIAEDQIHITSNTVIVNELLYDSLQNHSSESYVFKVDVPENSVFLLGDNRMEPIDSRMYGCIIVDIYIFSSNQCCYIPSNNDKKIY